MYIFRVLSGTFIFPDFLSNYCYSADFPDQLNSRLFQFFLTTRNLDQRINQWTNRSINESKHSCIKHHLSDLVQVNQRHTLSHCTAVCTAMLQLKLRLSLILTASMLLKWPANKRCPMTNIKTRDSLFFSQHFYVLKSLADLDKHVEFHSRTTDI